MVSQCVKDRNRTDGHHIVISKRQNVVVSLNKGSCLWYKSILSCIGSIETNVKRSVGRHISGVAELMKPRDDLWWIRGTIVDEHITWRQ